MFNMINLQDIAKAMLKKGYAFFEKADKPFNLNIIGIRSSNNKPNSFDDLITVSWCYKAGWSFIKSIATTDPGLYWLNNPMNIKGTAILLPGQYRGAFKKGAHKGYPALVQCGQLKIVRDYDRDKEFDYYYNKVEISTNDKINIHRASSVAESNVVDKWSAGCQVIANPDEFNVFMAVIDASLRYWPNSFTYTLLLEEDFY